VSTSPTSPPRRPYGSVALPYAVTAVPHPTRPSAPGHWQTGRVRLPLLSIEALRHDGPRGPRV
jgi:hypothetical protein